MIYSQIVVYSSPNPILVSFGKLDGESSEAGGSGLLLRFCSNLTFLRLSVSVRLSVISITEIKTSGNVLIADHCRCL